MPTSATNYAANIQQYNYLIYVDVFVDDCRSVMDHLLSAHIGCSSRPISQSQWRVLFQRGTEFGEVETALRLYDGARGSRVAGVEQVNPKPPGAVHKAR